MATNSGIIIPPPEIRRLADTTAHFVAKGGPQFEKMAQEKEQNNPQFCFMKPDDPYRPYFDHKIAEELAKKQEQEKAENPQGSTQSNVTSQNQQIADQLRQSELDKQKQQQQERIQKKKLKAPDPDQYIVNQPKGLTQQEVDIIKHAAQFVASNGKKFLVALTERERQNPQFDFLKPTNDLFPYFMELLESYNKCKNIREYYVELIIKSYKDKMSILKRCGERFEYDNYKKLEEKRIEQEDEEEKQKLAMIDWNDFVVVETIDFLDEEFQPIPQEEMYRNGGTYQQQESEEVMEKKASQVEEKLQRENEQKMKQLEKERQEQYQKQLEERNIEIEKQEIQAQQDLLKIREQEKQQELVAETQIPDDNIKLRPDYQPRSRASDQQLTKCKNCGKMIPIKEMEEHLKIELMNPEARELKLNAKFQQAGSAFNEGDQITANLQNMKRKRPDIFRQQDDQIGEVINEDEEVVGQDAIKKIQWDGQDKNMTRTTANIAIMQHQERKKNQEYQKQLALNKQPEYMPGQGAPQGNLVPPSLSNTQGPAVNPKMNSYQNNGKIIEEGVGLTDEMRWVSEHPENVKINIKIPSTGDNQLGQTIQFTLPPSTSILQIKIQLAQKLNNLAAAKQKLRSTLFQNLRDEKTLAFYNTLNNSNLELQILE